MYALLLVAKFAGTNYHRKEKFSIFFNFFCVFACFVILFYYICIAKHKLNTL